MYDFLIIGHGLAGAILARTLRQRGRKVLVLDELKDNSASNVAAGLINPVAGKRFAKSWQADLFLPAAHAFYRQLEEETGEPLFFSGPIVKLFSSVEEQNNWMAKSADPNWEGLVETNLQGQVPYCPEEVRQEHGGIVVRQGGNVDVRQMLRVLSGLLEQTGHLRRERLDWAQLEIRPEGVRYRDVAATRLIFCEGYQTSHNPYFSWLPFSLNKGELVDVAPHNFRAGCIYNKGVYVLPINGGKQLRVGATYNWRQVDETCTPEAREELLQKLRLMLQEEVEVQVQYAGIRPATRDRRPLIGIHPDHPALAVFNGMGSKGVMMAPWLASHFADVLEGQGPLLEEVNISRYLALYHAYKNQHE